MKKTVTHKVLLENEMYWREHTETLVKQGHFIKLALEEKADMIWKSYMYNLKRGTVKFLLNACLDTLPTQTNLLQWGKSSSDLCKLCLRAGAELQGRRKETTNHILNGCKVALHQNRYTWRHNNVLHYIYNAVDQSKCKIYADLPNRSLPEGGTIPPYHCITAERPDIVIIEREKMYIYELTIPMELNICSSHERKMDKYEHFMRDITDIEVTIIPIEIGARGFISTSNKANLRKLHQYNKSTLCFKTFCENLSSLALLSSYYIFSKRKSSDWDQETTYLKPNFV